MNVYVRRPALHAACILFALPLRWFTSHEALLLAAAACLFNLIFLPALAPSLYRSGEDKSASGIVFYPIAVLLMVAMLPLHVACAGWAIMALGDAAANLAGSGAVWPWNPRKTLVGSAAFAAAAFAGGSALWWWISFAPPAWPRMAIAAVVAALVESLPLPVDDNLTVSLAAALVLGTFPLAFVPAVTLSPMGAAVSLSLAAAALALGLLTISGAIAGFTLATLLYSFAGWQAFALLAAFFVLGSGATRVAYRRKQSMNLAESHKGKRVAAQAVANAGAAVVFAFLGQPLAMAAALAAATADTIATETGPLFGGRVFLLATGKVVKPGTSGGVSVAGTLAGVAGAAVIACLAMVLGVTRGTEFAIVTLAGATGSAVDSYLGGTLEKQGLLNNEGVNFLGTTAAGLLAIGLFR